jgi:hypothetical protein
MLNHRALKLLIVALLLFNFVLIHRFSFSNPVISVHFFGGRAGLKAKFFSVGSGHR